MKSVCSVVKEVGVVPILKELGIVSLIAEKFSISEDDLENVLTKSGGKRVTGGETKAGRAESTAVQKSTSILISNYSDKAIVVRGDTKAIKEALLKLGGKWNTGLKGGAGWIFPLKKKDDVCSTLTIDGVKYTDECNNDSSKPLEKEDKFSIKPENDAARKTLNAVLNKMEGEYDSETKCYTFSTKDRKRIEATLTKVDSKYKIVGAESTTKGEKLKTKEKFEPPKKVTIKRNDKGNLWDAETKIVFEKRDDKLVAVGVQGDDEVEALEDEHIKICKQKKWKYEETQPEPEDDPVSDIEL